MSGNYFPRRKGNRKKKNRNNPERDVLKAEKRVPQEEFDVKEKYPRAPKGAIPEEAGACLKGDEKITINHTCRLNVNGAPVFFYKSFFQQGEMRALHEQLTSAAVRPRWRRPPDNTRGTRDRITFGMWTAQGHHADESDIIPAGDVSKEDNNEDLVGIIRPYASKLSSATEKYCKRMHPCFEMVPPEHRWFELFHLFMAHTGISKCHTDRDDYVSVLFVIHKNGIGAELDLTRTQYRFNFEEGDVIFFDSFHLQHGNFKFSGQEHDRMVGEFILRRRVLQCLQDKFPATPQHSLKQPTPEEDNYQRPRLSKKKSLEPEPEVKPLPARYTVKRAVSTPPPQAKKSKIHVRSKKE